MILTVALFLQAAMAHNVAPQDRRALDREMTRRLRRAIPMASNIELRSLSIEPIATCLHKEAAKDTDRFLSTSLMSKEEFERGTKLLEKHRSCMGRVMSIAMPVPVLRGALAQRRLLAQQSTLDTFAGQTARPMGRVPVAEGRPFIVAYATCLAVSQPGWTAAFLRTPSRSPGEKRQFMQFGDALKNCMPVDRSYNVDMPALRDEMAAVVDRLVTYGDGAKNA